MISYRDILIAPFAKQTQVGGEPMDVFFIWYKMLQIKRRNTSPGNFEICMTN